MVWMVVISHHDCCNIHRLEMENSRKLEKFLPVSYIGTALRGVEKVCMFFDAADRRQDIDALTRTTHFQLFFLATQQSQAQGSSPPASS